MGKAHGKTHKGKTSPTNTFIMKLTDYAYLKKMTLFQWKQYQTRLEIGAQFCMDCMDYVLILTMWILYLYRLYVFPVQQINNQ